MTATKNKRPIFTAEGPKYYDAALRHNQAWAVAGSWVTALTLVQEANFKSWVVYFNIPFDVNASIVDYDMRGYWLANGGTAVLPVHAAGDHFPDTYKTPYDTTFSGESQYAKPGTPFKWHGNQLIDDRDGTIIFDADWKPKKTVDSKKKSKDSDETARVKKLQNSQLEAVTGDVDLNTLNLNLAGYQSEWIINAVTAADVERTIEGASTLTIAAIDYERTLQNSPYLAKDVYTNIDGLWFALVGIEKQDDELTLKWEDREVYILRKYNKPKTAAWGQTTRPKFIRDMVREVKELNIDFYCPELEDAKTVGSSDGAIPASSQQSQDDKNRAVGFPVGQRVTVKNAVADQGQKEMITRVLKVGIKKKARRKVLVTAIMTITVESTAHNLSGGDADSAGLFQQRPSQGWGTYAQVTDPEYAAGTFFDRAIKKDADEPFLGYGELAQAVQISAFPERYELYRTEAEHTVTSFGIKGKDGDVVVQTNDALSELLVSSDGSIFLGSAAGNDYQFTRGQFSQSGGKTKVTKENTWDCSLRLADEVQWRRFMVSGRFYYISEPYLFRSRPLMTLNGEYDDAVIKIDYRFDIGERNAEVTVTAFGDRWVAPPGSMIAILEMGPVITGRWLITNISRSLFSPIITITCKKPMPTLPEPFQSQGLDLSNIGLPQDGSNQGASAGQKMNTAKIGKGYVAPLATDGNLSKSEFTYVDAEGAPDSVGIRHHAGKDWFAPAGSNVVAPIDGTLILIEPDTSSDSGQVFGGQVKLQQDNGYVWVFRHVRPVLAFKQGARVKQGHVVASVAPWHDNPNSTHCHIEVWKTYAGGYNYDNMVDPVKFLKGEAV